MPRIVGIDIPKEKKAKVALTYIFGIGPATALNILKGTEINPEKRAKDLTEEEVSKIANYIQAHYKVEGELRRERLQNIRRLMEIGCYRGLRHRKGLPARGQRTRTNARTRKGHKAKVGGFKK